MLIQSSSALEISRQVLPLLTSLVQNLTLRNDCNLIPLAHGTQRVVLSKQSFDIHFTESLPIQRSVPSGGDVRWLTMHGG